MWTVEEMTLRDRFALEAMQHVTWHGNNLPQAAEACYHIADAMMAAREPSEDEDVETRPPAP